MMVTRQIAVADFSQKFAWVWLFIEISMNNFRVCTSILGQKNRNATPTQVKIPFLGFLFFVISTASLVTQPTSATRANFRFLVSGTRAISVFLCCFFSILLNFFFGATRATRATRVNFRRRPFLDLGGQVNQGNCRFFVLLFSILLNFFLAYR